MTEAGGQQQAAARSEATMLIRYSSRAVRVRSYSTFTAGGGGGGWFRQGHHQQHTEYLQQQHDASHQARGLPRLRRVVVCDASCINIRCSFDRFVEEAG